jgi:hypothetical protein
LNQNKTDLGTQRFNRVGRRSKQPEDDQ